jgi:hypothetical protein
MDLMHYEIIIGSIMIDGLTWIHGDYKSDLMMNRWAYMDSWGLQK